MRRASDHEALIAGCKHASVHRLLLCIAFAVIAMFVVACGANRKSSNPYQDVEEQLGLNRAGIDESQSRVEGKIRDCMKAQGFDYVPVDPFARQQALAGKARMTDDEFVKQFGYGISTLFGRGSGQADPNERLRKSLSSADRAAYDRALWGENTGAAFAEAVDTGNFADLGGCTKQATNAVLGDPAVLAALQGKLDELDERILQDQRMVKATEKWSACMARAGYRYAESDDIDPVITRRFQAIIGSGVRPGATTPAPGTSYDHAALSTLQLEEVKIANVDLACEHRYLTPVDNAIRPQYEADFRKQNEKLLVRVHPLGS